jgi:hypothetical protein
MQAPVLKEVRTCKGLCCQPRRIRVAFHGVHVHLRTAAQNLLCQEGLSTSAYLEPMYSNKQRLFQNNGKPVSMLLAAAAAAAATS